METQKTPLFQGIGETALAGMFTCGGARCKTGHLNLDRSALSKELGKMRDEGILKTTKNEFTLHELPE